MSSASATSTSGGVPASSESGESQKTSAVSVKGELAEFNVGGMSTVVARSDQAVPPPLDTGTIDSVLLRDHLIQTITLNGSEVINANLLGLFDPYSKLFNVPLVWDVVKPYTYFRGGIRVRVVCTPPGSCFGALTMSAICEGGLDVDPSLTVNNDLIDDAAVDSMYTSVNDVFRIINFEQASAVEFELPWVYYQDHMTLTQDPRWLWRLQMQSLVALQSTISTTAVATLKIYASFLPGYTLGVARYQAKKGHTGLSGFGSKVDNGLSQARNRVKDVLGGKISDISATVSSVASSVAGTVPFLAPFAAPIAAGAAAVSSIAAFFGFTRETSFAPPDPVVSRLFANLALVDGIDTSDKLVMTTGACLSIDPAIGAGEHADPMCFESIRQRWGIISYFDLTTGSAAGNVLHNLPVTPFYGGLFLGSFYLCPGGYYGLPSIGWRGGMEYMIYIPSSTNMRGMLQVAYQPSIRAGAAPFPIDDPTGQVNTVSLDLCGTQQHVLQVPYASPEPYKFSQPYADGKYSNRQTTSCNGSLDFYLSAAWVAPRTGTVSTRVFILARPMADMKFVQPRTVFDGISEPAPTLSEIRYQSALDDSVELFESTMLSQPLMPDFNLEQTCSTESFPSARALCQKFSPLYQNSTKTPATILGNFYPPLMNRDAGAKTWGTVGFTDDLQYVNFTWLTYYMALFVGIRGGIRWKYVSGGAGAFGNPDNLPYVLDAYMLLNMRSNLAPLPSMQRLHNIPQKFDATHAAEFAFPYVTNRLYQNPRLCTRNIFQFDGTSDYRPYIQVIGFAPTTFAATDISGYSSVVYVAGADDFSVTRFRRVPRLVAAQLLPTT